MIRFEVFLDKFVAEFDPDRTVAVTPQTGLYDDLGLDSFDAFRPVGCNNTLDRAESLGPSADVVLINQPIAYKQLQQSVGQRRVDLFQAPERVIQREDGNFV